LQKSVPRWLSPANNRKNDRGVDGRQINSLPAVGV
jgi:hypothetical protein